MSMRGHSDKSSPDEDDHQENIALKKKKRLYTPRARTRRIITAGPSQEFPTAESDLLDFRNRVSPTLLRNEVEPIPLNQQTATSEYDASCESLDIRTSEFDSREITEPEATVTSTANLRCQESIANDDPQEGLPPSVNAHLSFDAGYLASSDSMSTSDFRAVAARYTQDPDVSQWNHNRNPEIRIHQNIIYDHPFTSAFVRSIASHAALTSEEPAAGAVISPEQTRLCYREVGQTSSGGSVMDSSVSANPEPDTGAVPRADSQSDTSVNNADPLYDEAFEDMLMERVQNRIRELGGIGEYDQSASLTPAGREIKQRFLLLQDHSDEDERSFKPSSGKDGERGRRKRRQMPEWMLTDVPSNETLHADAGAPPSPLSSRTMVERLAGLHPARHSRSPDSESEVSELRDIRAKGGDQFVEAVLWRLQDSLRAGNNFREYRGTVAQVGNERYAERHHEQSSDEDSDATSSKGSIGRVTFQRKVLVRPLGMDPLSTEYRKPYSKMSKQKLSAVKEYSPEPDDPDYEDSLKDKTETTDESKAATSKPVPTAPVGTAPELVPKPQPGWKKLFCCIGGGGKPEEPIAKGSPSAAAAAPPPKSASEPLHVAASPDVKRKRRRVKTLEVQELDPNVSNGELVLLHMMFDDQMELCRLSDPETEASIDDPSELSDPDSEQEPSFAEFLKACGLSDSKVSDYMAYHSTHRALSRGDSGGDWWRAHASRPSTASTTEDATWWDKSSRERRQDYRRKRHEHREYQRQVETQRDLEVEAQLRRALETQRELLREREVERELDRTGEASKERKEMRLEEEVLEKELLKRLLGELQHEQVRAREREKRRTVAKVLEDELITRLQLELERQREKSVERKEQRIAQRLGEDGNSRELSNRIDELRIRIEENKILRDHERDDEQQRLQLLQELLVKERRRMDMHESLRLRDQDLEVSDRKLLVKLEARSEDEANESQKEYDVCAKTLLMKNEKYKSMRSKLTADIRKRELVKRKLISLQDIEKANPRLFQLAKIMEGVTTEKGCVTLEYFDGNSMPGILKKESNQGERTAEKEDIDGTEDLSNAIKTERSSGDDATRETDGVTKTVDAAGSEPTLTGSPDDVSMIRDSTEHVNADNDDPEGDSGSAKNTIDPETIISTAPSQQNNDSSGEKHGDATQTETFNNTAPNSEVPAEDAAEHSDIGDKTEAHGTGEAMPVTPSTGTADVAETHQTAHTILASPSAEEAAEMSALETAATASTPPTDTAAEPGASDGNTSADDGAHNRESSVQVDDKADHLHQQTADSLSGTQDTATAEGRQEQTSQEENVTEVADQDQAPSAEHELEEAAPTHGDDASIAAMSGVNDLFEIP